MDFGNTEWRFNYYLPYINICRDREGYRSFVCLEGQHFTMTIRDDGRGFSTLNKNSDGSKHLGLQSMRERASIMGAQLKVESAPGEGTCITVSVKIPVSAESPAREIASKDSRKPAC